MKKTILACMAIASFLSFKSQAQVGYIEGGGPGLVSANFDMRFTKKPGGIGGRIGVGGFAVGSRSMGVRQSFLFPDRSIIS